MKVPWYVVFPATAASTEVIGPIGAQQPKVLCDGAGPRLPFIPPMFQRKTILGWKPTLTVIVEEPKLKVPLAEVTAGLISAAGTTGWYFGDQFCVFKP